MADALDLRTPQMECPTCRATVRITGKGTIAQHTRSVSGGFRYRAYTRRCPSSFTPAPAGAHAAWLRAMLDERLRGIAAAKEELAALELKASAVRARAATLTERVAEIDAALAAIGATP